MPHATHSVRVRRKPKPKKRTAKNDLVALVKKTSLSQAALRLLVSRSPTPPIFDEPEENPPFDLQDK